MSSVPVPKAFEQLHRRLADPDLAARGHVSSPLAAAARASVLIMLSDIEHPDITFTERAANLRTHPGQVAFPGGGRDSSDRGPVDTALREAQEEIGLDPAVVHVMGRLPEASVPVSSFAVVPVVGWWDGQYPVAPVDPGEVASLHRWTIDELVDPQRRVSFRFGPGPGRTGPAWQFDDLFLWGFTAKLVDWVLKLGDWEQPWDASRVVNVPERFGKDRPRQMH